MDSAHPQRLPLDCALLVVSCDAYSDLWVPFFSLLRRHWPGCPFPVYLGTQTLTSGLPNVAMLHSPTEGRDWSGNLIDYLDQLREEYVLVMLDDFFLRSRVDTGQILHCLQYCRTKDLIHLRLIPRPKPTGRISGERLIGESVAGSPYRLCMQAAIWNRHRLRALLQRGESIWEFEHKGNRRAEVIPRGFNSVWRVALPYQGRLAHHVVEKGKWLPHEKWIFRRMDIGCDFSRRGVLPWRRTLVYHLAQLCDTLLDVLPWKQKQRVKQRLKSILRPVAGGTLEKLGQGASPPKA